jgi:hypothetical protein
LQGPPTPGRIAAAVAAAAGADTVNRASSAPAQEVGTEGSSRSDVAKYSSADPAARIGSSTSSSSTDLQQRNTTSSKAWQEERAALLSQYQLRTNHLEKLVAFAGHCRLMLQDLQPGAVAAAGQQQQGRRNAGAVAGKEPMARLMSLAQELDASRWVGMQACKGVMMMQTDLEQMVLR